MNLLKQFGVALAAVFLVLSCGACKTAFGIPYIGDKATCFSLQRELFACVSYCMRHFENGKECSAELCDGFAQAHETLECPFLPYFEKDFSRGMQADPNKSL